MDPHSGNAPESSEALEARLFEQIGKELDAQDIDKGIWTKAFAETMGDDAKTRALYIRRRFDKLLAAETTSGEVEARSRAHEAQQLTKKARRAEFDRAMKTFFNTPNPTAERLAAVIGLCETSGLAPHKTDLAGKTLLHYAAMFGGEACITRLLKCGADPNVVDGSGLRPIDYALRLNYYDVAATLVGANARPHAIAGNATESPTRSDNAQPPLAVKVAEPTSAGGATRPTPLYHGVGGWLTFLIIQLVALSPILGAYNFSKTLYDAEQSAPQLSLDLQWGQYKTACLVILGIAALISVSGGLKLMTDFHKRSVRIAIGALWLRGPAQALAYLVAGIVILRLNANASAGMAVIVAEVISAGVWTAYLLRSKRVRNTYLEAHDNERRPASKYAVILLAGVAAVALVILLGVYVNSAAPGSTASKSDAATELSSAASLIQPAAPNAPPATNHQNVATETKLGQAPDVIPFSTAPNAPPATNQQIVTHGEPPDFIPDHSPIPTSFEKVQKDAAQGNMDAQYKLGVIYQFGKGVPKNAAKAVEWYQKAAVQGQTFAQINLGAMYYLGFAVPKDTIKAVEWFQKAAAQGNSEAQTTLGAMYEGGAGIPKDAAKSIEWYQKAAAQGIAAAQYALGRGYSDGLGLPADNVLGYAWLSLAASRSYYPAAAIISRVESRMSATEIAEAQRLSSSWKQGQILARE